MGIGLGEIMFILFLFGFAIAIGVVFWRLGDHVQNRIQNRIQKELKTCPYCAEQIKRAAKICRYCQRDVASVEIENKPPRGLFQ
jgi:hypothetical protein